MTRGRVARALPSWLTNRLRLLRARAVDAYASTYYSQEGEDAILTRIFEHKTQGFYVDVGAHHPRRYSNTYLFYRKGWSGINIEPNPDVVKAFRRERPRDTNLQIGISDHEGTLTYYLLDEPALNTFNKESAEIVQADYGYKLLGTMDIPVRRLDTVLRAHLPDAGTIDFLSIDVEGFDMAVLKSNDWASFKPTCVLVEALCMSAREAMRSEVSQFMNSAGYDLIAKTINTLVFKIIE